MSAQQEIARMLEHWIQLAQAEAGAIQSADWQSLKEIQAAKTGLQDQLSRAGEKWETENPGRTFSNHGKHHFRAEFGRLLSMATRNAQLLATQYRRAEARRESLNEAVRNLRKLQQSYSLNSHGTLNCYS